MQLETGVKVNAGSRRLDALIAGVLRAADRSERWPSWLHTFMVFGIKQAWVCLFGGLMVALLIGTHFWYPAHAALPRYDALTLSAIVIQILLVWFKLEEWDEVKVILLFHIAGTGMELFKTAVGSWVYPEAAYLRIGGVPLFSGFMYASVGSYITRACREFDQRFTGHPSLKVTLALSAAIYANFFLHHYWFDCRYLLMACVALAFRRCQVYFRIGTVYHRMPLLLGFFLIALFIWLAENIGTFSHAWLYPGQMQGWSMVSAGKLGSWFMLTVMSYVLVTLVNRPRAPEPSNGA
ncbi:DUF817 domain-containing protein [Paraburkholderia sp. D15]|uniref:DUF817 domain-containing protein n=1 Tax=Paraburkholderia sp. D15 TaxID=2880218 RepID=UPI00247848BD|nr:DUF817 domain-containing protein [Paraburkholderia sp. D15]WGS54090.1 DUF817 domain-containing protein [Paraburkholderia sp. D15]WKF60370.1 hypothetical protein HUO10_004891 [Paraburkholderia busanensis]